MQTSKAIGVLKDLLDQQGPMPSDYDLAIDAINELHVAAYAVSDGLSQKVSGLETLDRLFADHWQVFQSTATNQGFARLKPHGYAGDFEIIERIYNRTISSRPGLQRWDEFWHAAQACAGVRNRADLLRSLCVDYRPERVLSVGSGPGLDILGLADIDPKPQHITLLDNDAKAIERARANLSVCDLKTEFVLKNALRWRSDDRFNLIWSAGLFDYLNDKMAVFLLKRLRDALKPGGRIAIGNFDEGNKSRGHMELFSEWFLIHRTSDDMYRLALEAGFALLKTEVIAEASGVNIFLVAQN